jgi:hypothetical protein
MARSSPSTDPGIERHSRNKAITPARVKIRAERCSGQPAWLKAPMAHYTSSMTFSRPDLARRLQRRWIRQSRLGAGGEQTSHPRLSRPKGYILMRVVLLVSFRYRRGPSPSKWHWEIGYSMARQATAPAAVATDLMPVEARKGRPLTAAIGFGVTEA